LAVAENALDDESVNVVLALEPSMCKSSDTLEKFGSP
jgi:hypothetical protein